MPIIAIDLDNTICNYTQALRDWCHQHMDASLPCPDPTVYDFNQTPGWPWDGTTLTFQNIHEQAVNDDLYLTEQPYPHALETLRQLTNTGHQIVIATSRNDDGTDSIEWLEDHHVLYKRDTPRRQNPDRRGHLDRRQPLSAQPVAHVRQEGNPPGARLLRSLSGRNLSRLA